MAMTPEPEAPELAYGAMAAAADALEAMAGGSVAAAVRRELRQAEAGLDRLSRLPDQGAPVYLEAYQEELTRSREALGLARRQLATQDPEADVAEIQREALARVDDALITLAAALV